LREESFSHTLRRHRLPPLIQLLLQAVIGEPFPDGLLEDVHQVRMVDVGRKDVPLGNADCPFPEVVLDLLRELQK
jgi:hypothetical protein